MKDGIRPVLFSRKYAPACYSAPPCSRRKTRMSCDEELEVVILSEDRASKPRPNLARSAPSESKDLLFRLATILALLLLLTSCGTPGAPMPPSLELPRPVEDLAASRKGADEEKKA